LILEDIMLSSYFKAPYVLERLRSNQIGPFLDGFAQHLGDQGYARSSIQRSLRASVHFGYWMETRGQAVSHLDSKTLADFDVHLPTCQCPGPTGGTGSWAGVGIRLLRAYLQEIGVLSSTDDEADASQPELPVVADFLAWMQTHRGASESTLRIYARAVHDLLDHSAHDAKPEQLTAGLLRGFVFERARCHGKGAASNSIKGVRMSLRYLAVEGKCSAALVEAVPTLAQWKLAALPRYLAASDIKRVIGACNPGTPLGARNRAVVLLLARLGLRAGEVVALRLSDVDWETASLRVVGKTRRTVQLPLSQEVGDALPHYLEVRTPRVDTDRLFLRARAPSRRPLDSRAISALVARAIRRAGVDASSSGAHVLRHSAVTAMLCFGLSLEDIGAVLRHRSVETTAHYAKVDLTTLRQIAQPWPEASLC
jgi:site-specific recombinase XerD